MKVALILALAILATLSSPAMAIEYRTFKIAAFLSSQLALTSRMTGSVSPKI
ncbi:MAG: hypothetical protein LUQ38_09990 [Methanotrichaceae archaeon]|nr:hypothetical protein [Methanotrichaceae archaeon]